MAERVGRCSGEGLQCRGAAGWIAVAQGVVVRTETRRGLYGGRRLAGASTRVILPRYSGTEKQIPFGNDNQKSKAPNKMKYLGAEASTLFGAL